MIKRFKKKHTTKKRALTIVIVTRDRPKTLEQAIEAIAQQTSLPDTCLIIDHNSSQKNRRKNKKITQTASTRLHIIYRYIHAPTLGAARNTGLQLVKTPYFASVDDDVILDSKWVDTMMTLFSFHSSIVGIAGKITGITNYWSRAAADNLNHLAFQSTFSSINSVFTFTNTAWDLQYIKTHGICFDPTLNASEDVAFYLDVLRSGGPTYAENSLKSVHSFKTTAFSFFKRNFMYAMEDMKLYERYPEFFTPANYSSPHHWLGLVLLAVKRGRDIGINFKNFLPYRRAALIASLSRWLGSLYGGFLEIKSKKVRPIFSSEKKYHATGKPICLFILEETEGGGCTRLNLHYAKQLKSKYELWCIYGKIPGFNISTMISTEIEKTFDRTFSYMYTPVHHELHKMTSIFIKSRQLLHEIKLTNKHIAKIIINLPMSGFAVTSDAFWKKSNILFLFHGRTLFERQSLTVKEHTPIGNAMKHAVLNTVYDLIQKFTLMHSNVILVHSTYAYSLVKTFIPKNINAVHIHPFPYLNLNVPRKTKRVPVKNERRSVNIGIFARIEPRKGIDVVVKAAWLLSHYTNLHFHIYGYPYDDMYMEHLQNFTNEQELNIQWHPHTDHALLLRKMQAMDLCIIPSKNFETLGLTTFEALQLHVPVIGSDSGATGEILNNVDGSCVFKNDSPFSLAKTILRMVHMKKNTRNKLDSSIDAFNQKIQKNQKLITAYYSGNP